MTMHFDLSKYWNPIFIETGTRSGNSVKRALRSNFKKIYSIELKEQFYKECLDRFEEEIQEGKVELLHGDSVKRLPDVLEKIDSTATFWLDAHWSGPTSPTARGNIDVPLMRELEVIAKHRIKNHTILIDDVRLFGTYEKDGVDWLEIQEESVVTILQNINPDYEIFYENGFVSNDILVAQVQC